MKHYFVLAAILTLCNAQSTAEPSSTIEPTNSTTEAPVTTTPSTTTTTDISTTTSPTTTIAPFTTPNPFPGPETGEWNFKNKTTNHTCILMRMAIQLRVSYATLDNGTALSFYDVPKNAQVINGSCDGAKTEYILLLWADANSTYYSTLNVSFELLKETSTEFAISNIKFLLSNSSFPNAKDAQIELANDAVLFSTPTRMSYHCTKAQTLNLTSIVDLSSTMTVSNFQFEAFRTSSSVNFSTAKDCDSLDTPDIVPIAVGCALAILIVVVLIAYLVGRRRQQARGYLSM